MNRIVITGMGIISSLGIGWEEFWKNLIAGKSGISEITSFDTSKIENKYAGEVKCFNPSEFIKNGGINKIGRASQMAIAATKLALKDADIDFHDCDHDNIVVAIGTTMGEVQVLEILNEAMIKGGMGNIDSTLIPHYPTQNISINVSRLLKVHGKNFLFANACSAGNYSLGYAFDLIKSARADLAIAGGVDAFSRLNITGFNRLFAVAPEKCQPFDKNRKGLIVGEGAGVVIIESLENALKRNAKVYAEILSYGLSCDGRHMTVPTERGIVKCMLKALNLAGLKPNDVDYICAHGTGTIQNDSIESKAVNELFSNKNERIPISSIKSMLGHTMGAASAIEAIACCLALRNKTVPPTINYETPDPACDIDCIPNEARKIDAETVLNNSYAFGGNNACLVLKSSH